MILTYLVTRLASLVPVLFGISIFSFLLIHLIPGDIVTVLVGLNLGAGPHAAEEIRRNLHLDDPLPLQYLKWLWDVLQGDLGTSLVLGFPVGQQIVSHLPVTLELAAMAIAISVVIGVPLGVLAARTRNSWPDFGLRSLSLLGLSTPDFFLGTIVILVGSLYLPSVHVFGYVPLHEDPLGNLESMVFPAATLGFAMAAIVMRYTRASMLEVLGEPYVTTAKAKGLNRRKVLYKHALRNALIPVVTVVGFNGAYLIGGTVIVEQVFALPGVGQLTLNSIYHRDYPMVQGAVLVITTGVVLINVIVDVLYHVLDPRIRIR
jgi:ABC-type dipeptide/oligopeptide/nickel transport system permease component